MRNKVIAFALFFALMALTLTSQPVTSSAHVVSPGARIRGFIIPQPDFADLNHKGIACVNGAEIGIVPEHRSEVTGTGFLVQGNAKAYAKLLRDDGEEITSQKLTGSLEEIKFKSSIPAGKMTNFTLRICYQGQPKDVVPKVRAQLTLKNLIWVDSPDHGGNQKVEIIDPPPVLPQGDTITLR